MDDIPDEKTFLIGGNIFKGKDLKESIKTYQQNLVKTEGENWNEIVCYAPKIQAVAAKANTFDEIPEEVLKYASDNDLTVVLI